MIVKLDYVDFKGQTRSYEFKNSVLIKGKNGAGKSSFKEAIAFVFAGTDMQGNRAPTHLISDDADQALVSVFSDKAKISRSIRRDGKVQAMIQRHGDEHTTKISQEKLNSLVGPPDLFLSIFDPGYFMELPEAKKQAVLNEVLKPIDRLALLSELAGFAVDPHVGEELKKKRPDRIAEAFAKDRRTLQKKRDECTGAQRVFDNLDPIPEKPDPSATGRLEMIEENRLAWKKYKMNMTLFQGQDDTVKNITAENERIAEEKAQLEKELVGIAIPVEADLSKMHDDMQTLQSKYKIIPPKPQLMELTEEPNCPACGQVVRKGHRDLIEKKNQEHMAKWEVNNAEVKDHNGKITKLVGVQSERIHEAEQANRKIRQEQDRLRTLEASIKTKIELKKPKPLPPQYAEPTPPSQTFTDEEYRDALSKAKAYHTEMGKYQQIYAEHQKAEVELKKISAFMGSANKDIEAFEAIERGLKALPEAEIKKKLSQLEMPLVRIETEGKINLVNIETGRAYRSMSTGERMKADLQLSMKLNRLAKRKLNIIFIDNAELVDCWPSSNRGIQYFLAMVEPDTEEIKLEEHVAN